MKQSNKNRMYAAFGVLLLASLLGQASVYADRDDRHERGARHEQRWDNKQHERKHADRGNWDRGGNRDRQYAGDRRWDRGPVVVQHVHYEFRDRDRARLYKQYQRSFHGVRWEHRPDFRAGYAMLPAYRPYITPVPVHVLHTLPPPPPGYVIGYYQGYNVVYDPTTYVILTAIDLLAR